MRVVENTVLRKIFELKRYEVTRELRGLHNENFMICSSYPIFFR